MSGWSSRGRGGSIDIPGDSSSPDHTRTFYEEVVDVPTETETTITTWVIPASPIIHLMRIEFGGENTAQFKLKFDGVTQARYATYFGSALDGAWNFETAGGGGVAIPAGTTVTVTAEHCRPDPAVFWCRVQYLEIN